MDLKYTVKEIVETGMLVAMAIVLDLPGLKIQVGSAGGSISFTMVPLVIIALRINPIKSFIGIGIVYGVITCLLDGWGFQYYPFDYLLAYGSLSVVSFFRKLIFDKDHKLKGIIFLILGIVMGLVLRFFSHSFSSMIFYEFSFVEATIYNSVYVFVSGVVLVVVMIILYGPLMYLNNRTNKKAFD